MTAGTGVRELKSHHVVTRTDPSRRAGESLWRRGTLARFSMGPEARRAMRFVWWRLAVLMGVSALAFGLYRLSQHLFSETVEEAILALAAWPLLAALILLYFEAVDRDHRARQRRRDRCVASRLNRMRIGEDKFFLYLRPFASTGGIRVLRRVARRKRATSSYFGHDAKSPYYGYRLDVVWNDLEAVLAKLLERSAPLAGLGRPGEQFGAARLLADEATWQELVVDLAQHAWLIFLLPSQDQGTRWELDLVMATPRLLEKTVFIVPGSGDPWDWIHGRAWGSAVDGNRSYRSDGSSFGAAYEPMRSNDELRREAIEGLKRVGAHEAAQEASNSSTGALIMLNKYRTVRLFCSLEGYTSSLNLNPIDNGSVYRLDLDKLDHALSEARRATIVDPRDGRPQTGLETE